MCFWHILLTRSFSIVCVYVCVCPEGLFSWVNHNQMSGWVALPSSVILPQNARQKVFNSRIRVICTSHQLNQSPPSPIKLNPPFFGKDSSRARLTHCKLHHRIQHIPITEKFAKESVNSITLVLFLLLVDLNNQNNGQIKSPKRYPMIRQLVKTQYSLAKRS